MCVCARVFAIVLISLSSNSPTTRTLFFFVTNLIPSQTKKTFIAHAHFNWSLLWKFFQFSESVNEFHSTFVVLFINFSFLLESIESLILDIGSLQI